MKPEKVLTPGEQMVESSGALHKLLDIYTPDLGAHFGATCGVFYKENLNQDNLSNCKEAFLDAYTKILQADTYDSAINENATNVLLKKMFRRCSKKASEIRETFDQDVGILKEWEFPELSFDTWTLELLQKGLYHFMRKKFPKLSKDLDNIKKREKDKKEQKKLAIKDLNSRKDIVMSELSDHQTELTEVVEKRQKQSVLLNTLLTLMKTKGPESQDCVEFARQKSRMIDQLATKSDDFKVAQKICLKISTFFGSQPNINRSECKIL